MKLYYIMLSVNEGLLEKDVWDITLVRRKHTRYMLREKLLPDEYCELRQACS